MIDYGLKKGEPTWRFAFQLTGSVFPKCFLVVFPISLLAVALKLLHQNKVFDAEKEDYVTGFYFLLDGAPWSEFSGFVTFVIVFRLSAAYATYWSAYTTTNACLGDWSGSAASTVAFCRGSAAKPEEIEAFLQKVIRLFSMLSACALQELSPRKSHQVWGLLTLNSGGLDKTSLATLDGSSHRVDLCYHWIQQMIVDGQRQGLLCAPNSMVARSLAELSSGMGKFGDAVKHATTQFNFPYAQTCKWLLVLYSLLMPMMMVRWSEWVSGAWIFTFVQLFFIWTLEAITIILENPFDTSDPNCIDVFQLQLGMNGSLLLLLNPRTRAGPPELAEMTLSGDNAIDFDTLNKRDTVHKAILKKEGWILTDEVELKSQTRTFVGDIESGNQRTRCKCCCQGAQVPKEIARSAKYCTTRYGIVDDQKTAAIAIGIFGDELVVAVPPTCRGLTKSSLITVQSVSGRNTKIGVKKISIQDRHKLHKHHDWPPDDFEDFGFEYEGLPAAVYDAGKAILALPISDVRRQEELAVQKQIKEAKMADQQGFGIDQISHIQTFEDFTAALVKECGMSIDEASAEWYRRKNLPAEYEQEEDPDGRLMIELNIKAFKAKLAETKQKEDELAKRLQAAREQMESAACAGQIDGLEKAIHKAEVDTNMSDEELAQFRAKLEAWLQADEALQEALQSKRKQFVRSALEAAREVKLQNTNCERAQKLWEDLVVEESQLALSDAVAVGEIDNLKAVIAEVRVNMADFSQKGLKEAEQRLDSWSKAEAGLTEASESKEPHMLKAAVDEAALVGLRSSKVALVKQLLAEQTAQDRRELDDAIETGTIAILESEIIEAEAKAVLTADELRSAHEILDHLKAADKALTDAMASEKLADLQGALAAADAAGLQGAVRDNAEAKQKELLLAAKEAEAKPPDDDDGVKEMRPEGVALPGEANMVVEDVPSQ